MDKFPFEIVERIVHEAAGIPLPPRRPSTNGQEVTRLAGVCRDFQKIIERVTFQTLRLTSARIPETIAILARFPHRIESVKQIQFVVLLPEYDEYASTRIETPAEQTINSKAFSMDIGALFDFLPCLEGLCRDSQKMDLRIFARSPTDYVCSESYARQFYSRKRPTFRHDVSFDLHEKRYDFSSLVLSRDFNQPAPTFSFIRRLWFVEPTHPLDSARYMDVDTISYITSSFKNIEAVSWKFGDLEDDQQRRRVKRSNIADTLSLLPASVKSFTLLYKYESHLRVPATTLMPGETEDRLTYALRQASQKLECMVLLGVLGSPQLFWPKYSSAEQSLPSWPHLKNIWILYTEITPEGEYILRKYASNDGRNYVHYEPNQTCLNKIYLAIALAVARMPKLQTISLQPLHLRTSVRFRFRFEIKGRIALATWESPPPIFFPSDELHRYDTFSQSGGSVNLAQLLKALSQGKEEGYSYDDGDGDIK
ncbi:hypothetical protein F5B20DRAFT_582955 [Whalleya microplaca]|nr:hypothetical protein F5B20DRAFT_582955 [Whalleya microplaca]